MAGITLRTARQVVPMIYAYTTPEIARHNGWTKIGYTEQSVDKRLKQQTHTADVLFHEEWRGNAVYDDGSGEVFTDHDFHAYLRKLNVENDRKNEWFHLDGQQSRRYFQDFRMNRGRVQLDAAIAYTLREEQARAVHDTKTYYLNHPRRGIPLERQAPLWQDPLRLRLLQAGRCTDGAHRHQPPCHRQ